MSEESTSMEPEITRLYTTDNTEMVLVDNRGRFSPFNTRDDGEAIKARLPVIGEGSLLLAQSTLPGAGFGLFADRDFRNGEIITFYTGPISKYIHPSKLDPFYATHARMVNSWYTMYGNYTDDGLRRLDTNNAGDREYLTGKGGGPFINHNTGVAGQPNSTWYPVRSKENRAKPMDENPFDIIIMIAATRDIDEGEEIFINYGNDYWQRAQLPVLHLAPVGCHNEMQRPNFILRDVWESERKQEEEFRIARMKRLRRVQPEVIHTGVVVYEQKKKDDEEEDDGRQLKKTKV